MSYLKKMWPNFIALVIIWILTVGIAAALAEASPYLATGWLGFLIGIGVGTTGHLVRYQRRE